MAYRPYNKQRSSWKPRQETVEFVRPTFTPSSYQQAIIDWIASSDGSCIVDAVAGSGKTSTLALAVSEILDQKKSYVVCAFNSSIADELKKRGMNGRTFHSLGNFVVRQYLTSTKNRGVQAELEQPKVSRIIDETYPDSESFGSALARLVSLAKNHIYTPSASDDDIISLIEHFDVDWEDDSVTDETMCSMVRAILQKNNDETLTFDFDDMLYFVELFNLRVQQFDYILVDESQDTNPLRRALIKRMMHHTSRVIAVGDERQAIYGFTGASHDSMDLIQRDFGCVRFPLSVSYRCPTSVIELAQTIVPHILPRDGAPRGRVSTRFLPCGNCIEEMEDFETDTCCQTGTKCECHKHAFTFRDFLPTDLVLCRNTAPLVSVAYKLLAARIPCKIMGREIGAGLTALIKRLTRKQETLETLTDRLLEHCSKEVEKATRAKKEGKAQAIRDKTEAIISIIDSMTPDDADGGIPRLIAIIDEMFTDKKNGCTTLATVHKAKGLESPRVIVLDRELMPSKMARQEWQQQQERNLMYVAYTRSLDTLLFVSTKELTD